MAQEHFNALYPSAQTAITAGQSHLVAVPLQQIDLGGGIILSAERGTVLTLTRQKDGTVEVLVNDGNLTLVNIAANSLVPLPAGSLATVQPNGEAISHGATYAGAMPIVAGGDRYHLADAVMVRQQQYLDSLKIDVRVINNALANLIRGLVRVTP
jgi:hypothetical protein